jgi:hypothetical protein
MQVLDSSPYKWLHELLECFNHGDLHQYDALCAKHAAVLNAQPALVENERRLREKVCAQMGAFEMAEHGVGSAACGQHLFFFVV